MKLEQKHGCPHQARWVPDQGNGTLRSLIFNWLTGAGHWEFGDCKQLGCAWFMELKGQDPQDPDRDISDWGCAVPWIPYTNLQVAKDVRQGTDGIQVATETFRNEMSRQNTAIVQSMAPLVEGPK